MREAGSHIADDRRSDAYCRGNLTRRASPYYIKSKGMLDGTYVRISGTTRPVEGNMLKELILEGQNKYYDCRPYNGLSVTDEEIVKI